jgi:hypothetical protein
VIIILLNHIMDFKSRFNGKTSHITKDGAYEVVVSTSQPITKVTGNMEVTEQLRTTQNQLINYGKPPVGKGGSVHRLSYLQ